MRFPPLACLIRTCSKQAKFPTTVLCHKFNTFLFFKKKKKNSQVFQTRLSKTLF